MIKGEELITVIIPVYNVKKYLKECLQSVLCQTYKHLEIILVDDGSTDGSADLCDEFQTIDARISVIHKKNAGLGFARNSGLDKATGKYITFLDSDDYIAPSTIEKLYIKMKEHNVDECKMGFQRVKDDHTVCDETKYKFELFPEEKAKTEYAPRLVGSAPDKHDSIEMCVWGAIFNGEIIQKYNLRFPSERELISEDLIFQLEYLQHANGACVIEDTDYKYRVNNVSLSQSYRVDRKEKSIFFYEDVVKRLSDYGYGEEVINRARRMLFIYIRMCIAQEVVRSGNSFWDTLNNIRNICEDNKLQEIIGLYPVNKLGITQRFFLECLKRKWVFILYFTKKCGLY